METKLNTFDRVFNIFILGLLLSLPVIIIEVLLYLDLLDEKAFTIKYGLPLLVVIMVFLIIGMVTFSLLIKRLRQNAGTLADTVNTLTGAKAELEMKHAALIEEHELRTREHENRWRAKFDDYRVTADREIREKLHFELSRQRELIEEEWNRIQKEREKNEKLLNSSETAGELKHIKDQIENIFGDKRQHKQFEVVGEKEYRALYKTLLTGVKDSVIIFNPTAELYRNFFSYLETIKLDNKNLWLCYNDVSMLMEDEHINLIKKMEVNLYYTLSDTRLLLKDNCELAIQLIDKGIHLYIKTDFSLRELLRQTGLYPMQLTDCVLQQINYESHYLVAQGIDKPVIFYDDQMDKINSLAAIVQYQPLIRILVLIQEDVYKYFYHKVLNPQAKRNITF